MTSSRIRRGLAAALLLGLLAAAGWVALRGGGDGEAGAALAAAPAEEGSSAGAPALRALQERDALEAQRAEVATVAEEASAGEAPHRQQTPSPWVVSGTLLVERRGGVLDRSSDGSLRWTAWSLGGGRAVVVQAWEGRWSVDLAAGDALGGLGRDWVERNPPERVELELREVWVDGAPILLVEPRKRIPLAAWSPLEVVVREPDATRLRVVDAATLADLDRVRVAQPAGFPRQGDRHPGLAAAELREGLRSPLDLQALAPRHTGAFPFLIGAEGYAWTHAYLDVTAGGERVLPLERGGDLVLALAGAEPAKGTEVRLWRADEDSPHVSLAVGALGVLRLEGLRPGGYVARAQIGSWLEEPLEVGTAAVTIAPGELEQAALVLEPAPTAPTADAAGLVLVAPEWEREHVLVTLELLDPPLMGQETHLSLNAARLPARIEGRDAFRWSRAGLQAGRYKLALRDPPASAVVELPAGGARGLRLEVPPPCELSVRVVDAATGADVRLPSLVWHAGPRETMRGGALAGAEYDASSDRYRIRAPRGEIVLMAWGGDFGYVSEAVSLRAARQEHVLRVERATEIEVVLLDGEARLAFPPGWRAEGTGPQGQPAPLSGVGRTLQHYNAGSGGRYRFRFPDIPGYEPIPDQDHDAPAGERSVLEVRLRKVL